MSFSIRALPRLLFAGFASAPAVLANEATLFPAKDNTMYSEVPSGSNGHGDRIFCGRTAFGNLRRALLEFDIAAALPAGATVQSVRLELNLSQTIVGPTPVQLYPSQQEWGEAGSDAPGEEGQSAPAQAGDATWTQRFFPATPWGNPGGVLALQYSASTVVDQPGHYVWGNTTALVADVQGWLDDPSSNHGWILVGDESGDTTAKRFDSRENPSLADRPRLVVSYTTGGCGSITPYCLANANSSGHAARIGSAGSTRLSANGFALTMQGATPDCVGLFLMSNAQGLAPFGNGFNCLGGTILRLGPPAFCDHQGSLVRALDVTQPPASAILAGSQWNFQCLYRDPSGGGAGFNLTNGLAVQFCP